MGNMNDGHFMGVVIFFSIPSHLSLLAKGIHERQYPENTKQHTYTIRMNPLIDNDRFSKTQKMAGASKRIR
jgi:hypothetical protein